MVRKQNCSLADIAAMANVSRTTVSRVLLNTGSGRVRVGADTAELIRRLARENHYRPNRAARQLKGIDSRTIAVLLYGDQRVGTVHPVFLKQLLALEHVAAEESFKVLLVRYGQIKTISQQLDDLLTEGVRYLFSFLSDEQTQELLAAPEARQFSAVALYYCHGVEHKLSGPFFSIQNQRRKAIQMAVKYLENRGRKRIAVMLHPEVAALVQSQREGEDAVDRIRPELWSSHADLSGADNKILSIHTAEAFYQQLIVEGKADAVICSNDYWALSLRTVLMQHKVRVPEDVALVGFDNMEFCECMNPGLTSFDQEYFKLADAVLKNYKSFPELLSGRVINSSPRLIERQSC